MTRFSFSFSRIFRSWIRRAGKDNVNSTHAGRFSSEPTASDKSRRPGSSQLEPLKTAPAHSTTRPRSVFTPATLSPIAQSPLTTSPGITPITDKPTPILIIGQDPAPSSLPSPSAPVLSSDVGRHIYVNGLSLVDPPERRVSFQLPTTQTEDRPESPVSTCSTLVSALEAQAGTEPAVPPQQPPAPRPADSGSVRVASAETNAELDDVVPSGSGRARPISFFSPQPVRVNLSRFSLPATRNAPIMMAGTNTWDDSRESNRTLLMPPASGSGSAKKEKRMSRWSRELNKPETQEVLRMLASTRFG